MTHTPSREPRRRRGHSYDRPKLGLWYCDLYGQGGWIHACPACWIGRFFFVIMVLAPVAWILKERLHDLP